MIHRALQISIVLSGLQYKAVILRTETSVASPMTSRTSLTGHGKPAPPPVHPLDPALTTRWALLLVSSVHFSFVWILLLCFALFSALWWICMPCQGILKMCLMMGKSVVFNWQYSVSLVIFFNAFRVMMNRWCVRVFLSDKCRLCINFISIFQMYKLYFNILHAWINKYYLPWNLLCQVAASLLIKKGS